MDGSVNRQILLIEKPTGKLGAEHFRLVETMLVRLTHTPPEG